MKILGCPLKISSLNAIHFPVNYLLVYGIKNNFDSLIREQHDNFFVFRLCCERELLENEEIVNVREGNTYLPDQWIVTNGLIAGKDSLYLAGIDDGLIVSTTAQINL
jgi:hypothetical protein